MEQEKGGVFQNSFAEPVRRGSQVHRAILFILVVRILSILSKGVAPSHMP